MSEACAKQHLTKHLRSLRIFLHWVQASPSGYSFHYAELGHDVFAGDIVPKHIDIIQKKLNDRSDKKLLKIKSEVMNAIDLTRFDNSSFDVVLCIGPLYHLLAESERDNICNNPQKACGLSQNPRNVRRYGRQRHTLTQII